MKKLIYFSKFLERTETLEVGFDQEDKTSNSLSKNSVENLGEEIKDYNRLKGKVDSIIMNADGEDVSKEIQKLITNDKTYGTNRFLRMYSSIAYKKKQVENLEQSIDKQSENIKEVESKRNDIDRGDRESMRDFDDKLNDKKKEVMESKKKLAELEDEIKYKELEVNKFMKEVEKDKQKSSKEDKWKGTYEK